MSNPLQEHIESCETCKVSQTHINHIVAEVQKLPAEQQTQTINCADCEGDIHGRYYVLNDKLWEEISRGESPLFLCIFCSEKRLGRRLLLPDFKIDAPVNAPWIYAIERFGRS
jgi:hypothetical protein